MTVISRITLQGLLVIGVAMVVPGCRRQSGAPPAVEAPAVRVATPVVRDITEFAHFTGRMDAVESVEVRARVTGYLDEVKFEPGQDVQEGQKLFKIDPRPYQAAADQAHSQIALAEAKRDLARADFNRAAEIAKTPGAISQQEIDTAAAMLRQADAQLTAAKAAAESADLNLEFTDVTAPIAGVIGRPLLTVGNLVTQDSSLLTTIVSQDPMWAYFDVDEHAMLRYQKLIREGKVKSARAGESVPVEVGLANDTDYPHKGQLDFVNNRVNPDTGTIQVRGVFPNPLPEQGKVRLFTPGLFVRVRLPIGEPHPALLVPQSAIGMDQGHKYLLVVNDKDVVEYRPITTGPVEPDGLQVVLPVKMVRDDSGIRESSDPDTGEDSITAKDRVIVGGLQRVRPGDKVTPRTTE